MKTRTLEVYSDPSHAWIKVTKPFLADLFGPYWRAHFTPFSYERLSYVYLEEDCDARTLINRLKEQGIKVMFKERPQAERLSRIRNYTPLAPRPND